MSATKLLIDAPKESLVRGREWSDDNFPGALDDTIESIGTVTEGKRWNGGNVYFATFSSTGTKLTDLQKPFGLERRSAKSFGLNDLHPYAVPSMERFQFSKCDFKLDPERFTPEAVGVML